jgi:hypothetical protein
MSRKEKTYKEQETEQRLGRKRYIERLVEDKEAAAEIEEFLDHPEQEDDYDERSEQRPFT